jgi:hypothetical protein
MRKRRENGGIAFSLLFLRYLSVYFEPDLVLLSPIRD